MRKRSVAAKTAGIVAGSAGAAAAGWMAYSALGVNHHYPLEAPLDASGVTLVTRSAGRVQCYAARAAAGVPLALIHSVNAAASAYEMRPLFERYRRERTVLALDLPGFGFSERSPREYSPELYARAIVEWLEDQLHEPADVVALSLGGEFAARAALARPGLFRSLALISPTGFSRGTRTVPVSPGWHRALSFPLWAQAFYDLLVSPPSIHYYLGKSFAGPVDPGLAEYDYATSHQPGARHAPLRFVAGLLFTPAVRETLYAGLRVPVRVLYDRDGYVSFDELPGFLARHTNWSATRIHDTMGLPHFEKPVGTARALAEFWEGLKPVPAGDPQSATGL